MDCTICHTTTGYTVRHDTTTMEGSNEMIDRIENDGTVIIEPGYFEGYSAHLLTRDGINPADDVLVINVWHDSWPANTYAAHVVSIENGDITGTRAVISVIEGDSRQSALAAVVAEHFIARGLTLS